MKKQKKQYKISYEWNTDYAEYPWTSAICPHCNEHLTYEGYAAEDNSKGDVIKCYVCHQEFELGDTDYDLRPRAELTARELIALLPKENKQTIIDMLKNAHANVGDCNGITEADNTYLYATQLIEKMVTYEHR